MQRSDAVPVPFLKDQKMTNIIKPNYLLRLVLALTGCAIVFLGLNIALGGITTLGWQGGGTSFVTVADPAQFAIHDSHVRFIGGVWLAVGLVMLIGSAAFQLMRQTLIVLVGMVFVGGLSRFSAFDPAVLMSTAIAPSFIVELVLFPLLGLWISKAERT